MGYFDEYNDRKGKCDFCKHNHTSFGGCAECYGSCFEDNLDLYRFIRNRVTEDSSANFNKSEEGKRLFQEMKQYEYSYYKSKELYECERNKFLEKEIKRVDEILNSI